MTGDKIYQAIRHAGFEPLGSFLAAAGDDIPQALAGVPARQVLVIGNAGPAMFRRFQAERDPNEDLLDDWCRDVLAPLATTCNARAVFPFDKPFLPFVSWARRAGCGFSSPLGMNIHPVYGLWHAFRAAFLFDRIAVPVQTGDDSVHPCDTCADKPCLSVCPVNAFSPGRYDVEACTAHLRGNTAPLCSQYGCAARVACPVGQEFQYTQDQIRFHMAAFIRARAN